MPQIAVSFRLDQRGSITAASTFNSLECSTAHCQDIHAINDDTRNPIAACPIGNVLNFCRLGDMRGSGVLVVLADENYRGLLDSCHVDALMECADIRGAIPEEADSHPCFSSQHETQCSPSGNGDIGSHDRIRWHHSHRHI